ncbi:MAG: sodium/solute symporter, partial [Candidatus Latescibacteria bacterium]|nr:sodium/solute symporter [Candidatus Latescibacterota bacterium]
MISLSLIDYVTLTLYIIIVVAIGIYFSRKHDSSVDYFLAGRNLSWWTIGGSLVASNISTESFVGMSGSGYKMGLAIACYDWLAAVGLIIVAKFLLPLFIKNRIYTMPEFLEIRYNHIVRFILSVMMIFGYVMIALAAVLYSGGLVIHTMFDFPLIWSIIVLAVVAGAYTVYGGLKAVVYTDIVQVITLLLGGIIATIIGLKAIGGIGSFWAQSSDKFHLVLPLDHPELPWIGVFVGLWIPNIFYWGCNQFITQRTLAAKNIHEAQIGVVFASFIKLIMPFIVVIPGIIAYALYSDEIPRADMAYPYL